MEPAALRKLWEQTLGHPLEDATLPHDSSVRPRSLLPVAKPPRKLSGRFRVDALIGKGGFGEVFRAHQEDLEREVALKKLRPDHSTPLDRAAFLAEAVVTGRLEHPNIVPIYTLDRTGDGAMALAMKLVEGKSWKQLLPEHGLVHHLNILDQVCNAVAFAHSRDIVHADLKPTNVMVGAFGEVTVLDWGNAVSLSDAGPARIRRNTSVRMPCGTPAYMAPELALGKGERIGPWTDVYLLGGILHHLLTGMPPHMGGSLIEVVTRAAQGAQVQLPANVPEELAMLCRSALQRVPADRPASVLEFQARLRAFLRHRESHEIVGAARATLAACRERAGQARSEADRNQLYYDFAEAVAGFKQAAKLWPENPEALQGSVEAHRAYAESALALGDLGLAESQASMSDTPQAVALRAEIVRARASRASQLRVKRRLQWGLLVALGLILAVSLGAVVLLRRKNFEIEAKNRMIAEEKSHAEQRGAVAQKALDQLTGEVQNLLEDELADARAHKVGRRILDVALEGWQALRGSEQDGSLGTAQARLRVGRLLLEVSGDTEAALLEFRAALHELEVLQDDGAQGPELVRTLGMVRLYVGDVLQLRGELTAAREAYLSALDLHRQLVRDEQLDPARERNVALCLLRLAAVAEGLGESERAQARSQEALSILRPDAAAHPGDRAVHRELAAGLDALAGSLEGLGEHDAARAAWQEALDILRAIMAEEPSNPRACRDVAYSLVWLGDASLEHGGEDAAASLWEEALLIRRALLERDPFNAGSQAELSLVLERVGGLYLRRGDAQAAQQAYAESLELDRQRYARDPNNFETQLDLAISLYKASQSARALGALEDARRDCDASLEHLRELVLAHPEHQRSRAALLSALESLGNLAQEGSEYERAGALYGEALEWIKNGKELSDVRHRARLSALLGDVELEQGEAASALPLFRASAALRAELVVQDSADFEARVGRARVLYSAVQAARQLEDLPTALSCLEATVEALQQLARRDAQYLGDVEVLAAELAALQREKALRDRLAEHPEAQEDWFNLGELLLESHRDRQGLQAFQAGLQCGPATGEDYLNTALVAARLARDDRDAALEEQAFAWLRQGLEALEPDLRALREAAAQDPAAEAELQQLLQLLEYLRSTEPSLSVLRSRAQFEQIFARLRGD